MLESLRKFAVRVGQLAEKFLSVHAIVGVFAAAA